MFGDTFGGDSDGKNVGTLIRSSIDDILR